MSRIVVDWGSSNFRAYRFGNDGAVVERHQANAGILTVSDGAFEAVLMREIGPWITARSSVLLSGMITSRNGWVETPYVELPASVEALATHAVRRQMTNGATLLFLPGVCARQPSPDVMRGEEIQVFGSVSGDENVTVVLPGTHSKWVSVRRGSIAGFRTFLTGETYALLSQHSIIGRLIPPGLAPFDEIAFADGVRQALDPASSGLLNDVFTARSGALLGNFLPPSIADRLSGILVGHEIRSGLAIPGNAMSALRLVGESALLARYQLALGMAGITSDLGPPDAAVEGFRRLAALGTSFDG